MSFPLVQRSTGDVIPASDHNDVKDYIEDGTSRINTKSLSIEGFGSVIDSSANGSFAGSVSINIVVNNQKISLVSSGSLDFTTSTGSVLMKLDASGNVGISGMMYQL